MIQGLAPRWPVSWLIRHRFESERKIRKVTCPTLIAHSSGDELIPAWMADRLAAAAGGPVSRLTFPGVQHRVVEFLQVAEPDLVPALRTFLAQACS